MMLFPNDTIESAIQIIGTSEIEDDEIERRVRRLVSADMTAIRLIVWIPEVFGLVLVSHMSEKIIFPTTFSAKNRSGDWVTLDLSVEPIFTPALGIAQRIYHEGPRETFQKISVCSSMINVVNNALNGGATLDGTVLSVPP